MTPRWLPRGPGGFRYKVDAAGRWWVTLPNGVSALLRVFVEETWRARHGAYPPEQVLTGRGAA